MIRRITLSLNFELLTGMRAAYKNFLKKSLTSFVIVIITGRMKQMSRALSLGFACSLVVGVMAGQSAFGSVADLGAASGSSVTTTSAAPGAITTVTSTPGSVSTTTVTPGASSVAVPWGHLNPVPEANAGFILAALLPLMLLMTPTRVRKVLAAFRSSGNTDSPVA